MRAVSLWPPCLDQDPPHPFPAFPSFPYRFLIAKSIGREQSLSDQVWDFSSEPAERTPLSEKATQIIQRLIEARDIRRKESSAGDALVTVDTPEQFFTSLAKPRRKAPRRTRGRPQGRRE